jgi:hypothetical protein
VQGPKGYASLKNLSGRNWNNEIQSVIVGSDATVMAYSKQDFKGTELAFTPGQRIPDLSKLDMSFSPAMVHIMESEVGERS